MSDETTSDTQPVPDPQPSGDTTAPATGASPEPMPAPELGARVARRAWILWVAIALVAALLIGGGYAIYRQYRATAARNAAIEATEKHFLVAVEALSVAEEVDNAVNGSTSPTVDLLALEERISASTATARTELSAARVALAPLAQEPAAAQLEASMKELDQAATELETASKNLAKAGELVASAQEVGKRLDNVSTDLDDAVAAANAGKWVKAVRHAKEAKDDARWMVTKLQSMAELDKQVNDGVTVEELAEALAFAKREQILAGYAATMAALGRTGSITAFNRAVDRYNGLADKLETRTIQTFEDYPKVFLAGRPMRIDRADKMVAKAKASGIQAIEALRSPE